MNNIYEGKYALEQWNVTSPEPETKSSNEKKFLLTSNAKKKKKKKKKLHDNCTRFSTGLKVADGDLIPRRATKR